MRLAYADPPYPGRALDERFNVNHVTRWLELALEVNAGNRDMFPNEIKAALRGS